jgi:O-antigen biosynthesis protein WbqP
MHETKKAASERHELTIGQKCYLTAKYILDFLIALCALAVLLLPMGILCAAIYLEDKGPVIFTQKRIGKDQKTFTLYKFRTMKMDTPHDTPTHLLADPQQYITKAGRFLRKFSLDELPQLLNILLGHMSLVGPRPALWNQYDLMAEREKYGVHQLRPGLTGWAQINGRDELEIPVKAALDGEYLRNVGLAMDVRCMFGTVGAVVRADGVVEGGTGAKREQKK